MITEIFGIKSRLLDTSYDIKKYHTQYTWDNAECRCTVYIHGLISLNQWFDKLLD